MYKCRVLEYWGLPALPNSTSPKPFHSSSGHVKAGNPLKSAEQGGARTRIEEHCIIVMFAYNSTPP